MNFDLWSIPFAFTAVKLSEMKGPSLRMYLGYDTSAQQHCVMSYSLLLAVFAVLFT